MSSIREIICLGTGTSTGIPLPGCACAVCTSTHLKNKRLRTSILIETSKKKRILIDTSPDLRSQVLAQAIPDIDAVIITHDHADHLHGIDDLRPFCFRTPLKRIPIYTYSKCAEEMRQRFQYIFNPPAMNLGGGIPLLDLVEINPRQWVKIEELDFYFELLPHGHTQTLSFYVDGYSYIVDCQEISAPYVKWLKEREVKFLFIDCLKDAPHQTHLNYQKAIQGIKDIGPLNAGLLHLSHDFDHESLEKRLQDQGLHQVQVCYDGLRVKI